MQRESSSQSTGWKILMSNLTFSSWNPAWNVHFRVQSFVWATRGRVGEWRNFAQLLRKFIVVDNPLKIEIGRAVAPSGERCRRHTYGKATLQHNRAWEVGGIHGGYGGWGPRKRKVKRPRLPKLVKSVLEKISFHVTSVSYSLFAVAVLTQNSSQFNIILLNTDKI